MYNYTNFLLQRSNDINKIWFWYMETCRRTSKNPGCYAIKHTYFKQRFLGILAMCDINSH